jgi:hypothetical protein
MAIKTAVVLGSAATKMAKLSASSTTMRKRLTIPTLVLLAKRGKSKHIQTVKRKVQISLHGVHRNGAMWIHVSASLQQIHGLL